MSVISIETLVINILNKYRDKPNTLQVLNNLDLELGPIFRPNYNYVVLSDLNNKVSISKLEVKFWPIVIPDTAISIKV